MKSKTKAVGGKPTTQLGQDWASFLQGGLGSGNFGNNAMAQTSGFGGAINSLLGGQIGDPRTLQGFFQGLQGNGGVGNLPNVSGNFNAPQFQGLDFGQLGQVGTQSPFNPQQFQNVNLQNPLGAAAGLDPNGSFSQALQQIANQQLNQGVSDIRERFTGGAGTNAGFAEAAYRAQALPQLTAALSQANQQERGLNLQQLGLNQDSLNQLNNLNLTQGLAGNQFGLQNQQLGLQGFGLQQQGQGMNAQNALAQMQQMLGQNQFMNQFGQQNAQFGANLGQQAQGMNAQNMLQNQGMMNQFGLGQAGVGLQNQGQQLQAILGALGPLFGGLQQAYGASTPQAQIVQQPSLFSQITGGIANLGQGLAPFFTGGFGGFGGNQMAPPVNVGGTPYQSMPQGMGIGSTPMGVQPWNMPLVNQQQFPWMVR